ncbi:hypothetical protein [Halioxenophilus sp. WMMB6]|uniref:hypothetical protein n=1 Tax=Halioxenophilus sp. WMMB6 TaxID=3073815 RepID=UPI00295EA79A|nr:hypothetical protein [Halioxenophilus sp. WMMB6]
MNIEVLKKSIWIIPVAMSGPIIRELLGVSEGVSAGVWVALLAASVAIAALAYFIEVNVLRTRAEGPDNSPIRWYQSPVFWLLIPMVAICAYFLSK